MKKSRRWWRSLSWGTVLLVTLLGCVHPIPRNVLPTVEKELTFSRVIENPPAYEGGVVLWGGIIRKPTYGPEETALLITQTPLDRRGFPQTGATEGEFIAHTSRHLDPEIFKEETKITLVGEIDGVEEKKWGPQEYPRPLVRIIDIHAWIPKLWGIFMVSRRGWEIDEMGPLPSPFEVPAGERVEPYP